MTTNKPENSDRELLELAAKASGIDEIQEIRNDGAVIFTAATMNNRWDPLNNDGDALRLAVRLGITVSFWDHLKSVAAYTPDGGEPAAQERYSQGNKAVATRLAIVRAAAEIGRDKP